MKHSGSFLLKNYYNLMRAAYFWRSHVVFPLVFFGIITENLALVAPLNAKAFLFLRVDNSFQKEPKPIVHSSKRMLLNLNPPKILNFISFSTVEINDKVLQHLRQRRKVSSHNAIFREEGAASKLKQVDKRIIRVSPSAALHIKTLKESRSQGSKFFLRMGVKSGGCSGLSYTMNQVSPNEITPSDYVEEFPEVGFYCVIDPKSMLYMFGMELDYSDALIGGGFKFHNPNAAKSCGCGMSFGVPRNFGIGEILSKPEKCFTNNTTQN